MLNAAAFGKGKPNHQGRVLILSDEPNIRRALRITLVARGFEVTDTQTTEAAFEPYQLDGYDLVLLDDGSRENTGIEECRKIRSVSDVAVIMMSDANRREAEALAAQAGANDVICKPFDVSDIGHICSNTKRFRLASSFAMLLCFLG
jgi:DNA-binding response OmpR family regulator